MVESFIPLLEHQGRLESGVDVYTATVEPVPAIEALGLSSQSEPRRVDALSFQDLTEGAPPKFASIAKVKMPELRARSTYKFVISVRADLFDAIPTENKPVAQQKKNIVPCSDTDVLENVGIQISDDDSDKTLVKMQSTRELEKLKQLASIDRTPEIDQQIKDKISEISSFEMQSFKDKLDSLPFVVEYKISNMKRDFKAVASMMTDYDKVLTEVKEFGVKMSPDVSLATEANKLSSCLNAIKKVSSYNSVDISENNQDSLLISFNVIRGDSSDENKIMGLEIKTMSVKRNNPGITVFNSGMPNFLTSSPITSRTTMVYLALMGVLSKQAARHRSQRIQGIEPDRSDVLGFVSAYHHPKPEIDFSSMDIDFNKAFGSTLEDFDYSVGKIKDYSKKINLDFNLSKNLGVFEKR